MPNKKSTEMPWDRQKGESAQAFEAFSLYLQMGPDRSLQAVCQKLGKSRQLISRWSSANNWVERVRAWDNHLQHEAQKAAVSEVRQMNRRHANMAQQIQMTALQALKDLGADMVNPKNFAAIVKLATELERESLIAEAAALGGNDHGAAVRENNLFAAIAAAAEGDIDENGIPELQSPPEDDNDMVGEAEVPDL